MTPPTPDETPSPPGPALLTGHAEVASAMRAPEAYTTATAIDCGQHRPLLPLQVEPPLHGSIRAPLEPYFSAAAAAQQAVGVGELVDQLLAPLPRTEPIDLNARFSRWVPVLALLRLLGLPADDASTVRDLHDHVLHLGGDGSDVQRRAAADQVYAYFEAALSHGQPRGLLHGLLGDGTLDRDQIVDVCFTLLLAGIDPVSQAIAVGACVLAGAAGGDLEVGPGGLAPRSLEELLRWGSPVDTLPRAVVGADGCPTSQRVGLSIREANRDAGVFADPDRLDPARREGAHLSFGAGPHRCIGAHLARLQVRVALDHLRRTAPSLVLADPEGLPEPQRVRAQDRLLVVLGPPG
ncbi:cytochrome P450 [Aquihabitans daechungensis]|uniref:cytochrome P450 n=1 Tax=Aquihabitans daechungensis TaxID=1052257 RepID=UPI003BA1C7C1